MSLPSRSRTTGTAKLFAGDGLRWLPRIVLAVDVLALLIAMMVAALLWRDVLSATGAAIPSGQTVWLILVIPAVWLVCLRSIGAYEHAVFGAGADEYRRVMRAGLLTLGIVAVGAFFARVALDRSYFLILVASGMMTLLVARFVVRRLVQRARRAGHLLHRVVVAGAPGTVDEVAGELARQAWLGFEVVGALTPPTYRAETTPSGHRVWATTEDAAWAAERLDADVLLLTAGAFQSSSGFRQAVYDLERTDVQVVVAPNVVDTAFDRLAVRPVGGVPLINIEPPRHRQAVETSKRVFDVVATIGLLLLFAPVLALAAWQIRRHDQGPVLFRQTRVGLDGQRFDCLKLRTMVVDAEERLAELQREAGFDGGLFKMQDDPRITPPGRWLRRFSIDELPQLVNVLRGEMSLVGPRPALVTESAAYDDLARRRLRVRPGMTGLWQVSGRSDLNYHEAIRLDVFYVDNWSMIRDVTILLRTFKAVATSRGAY